MKWELNKGKIEGKSADFFSTFPFIKGFLAVFLAAIIIFAAYPSKTLELSDFYTHKSLKVLRLNGEDRFAVKFTHSVELTPVWDVYEIRDDGIYLVETVFQSYGAGLPSTSPYDFEITDNGFRIYNINMMMDSLVYRTGAVRAGHVLVIGDREYPFTDFSHGEEAVLFEIRKMTFIEYLIKEGF